MSDGLFDAVLAAGPIAEQVDDRAWVQAMLDFEGALARASADAGLIPSEAALTIERHCRVEEFDIAVLGAQAIGIGNPAGPLVRALTAKINASAAAYVHFGATSQDVVDTAAMLVTDRSLTVLDDELRTCIDRLARFAASHAQTLMAGRSLLQQAGPVTFGLVAAGWLTGLAAGRERINHLRRERLAVQFGGAAGTLAAMRGDGVAVLGGLARRLALAEPALPWHTERSRIAEVAGTLGQICGTVAKIARDITLLAQSEVAEVYEEGPAGSGGSSTMPHKRNPVAAILASGSAAQAPGLVAALFGAAAAHEYQRAAGAWHGEWRPYIELLRTTGSAVHWLGTSLERLRVDVVRMRANVGITSGLLLAENVAIAAMFASDGAAGRQAASDAVASCCGRAATGDGELADLVAADPALGTFLERGRIEELLDADQYLGSTKEFIVRVLDRTVGES
ncbi:3-carboxy-cis,cis-muconate cycloisomerase [Nocardia sp. NPDC004123]